ncbi:MAG: ADP-ribosylglycohydrolase family protein, partial [Deferribacterales bacterium]
MNNKDRVSDCLHSKNTLNSIKETTSLIADRVRGMIAGNILGDMVGLPLEGMKPTLKSTPIILEKIEAARLIQEHLAKYNCNIYSDDTSMFIALIYSLLEKGKVDKENELNHYRKWLLSGKYTPDGKPFGYGKTTYKAVTTGAPGSTREENGNGALMRSSIITAFYLDKSDKTLEEASAESASVTHAHPISIFSNIIYNILLKYTILGKPLHRTIDELYDKFRDVMPDINDIFFDPIIY